MATFHACLGKYVREEHVIPLEDAIRKMTSAVANRLSIPDRGLLKEGMFADMVMFDPATVADHATYEKPHQLSSRDSGRLRKRSRRGAQGPAHRREAGQDRLGTRP